MNIEIQLHISRSGKPKLNPTTKITKDTKDTKKVIQIFDFNYLFVPFVPFVVKSSAGNSMLCALCPLH
jgi:hypothetical protein